jgi:hypothetical protein
MMGKNSIAKVVLHCVATHKGSRMVDAYRRRWHPNEMNEPYDTIPNSAPRSGDDQPLPLHCMVMVDRARLHVCQDEGGRWVGS